MATKRSKKKPTPSLYNLGYQDGGPETEEDILDEEDEEGGGGGKQKLPEVVGSTASELASGAGLEYTGKAAQLGLNPSLLAATGGLSALAVPIGFIADVVTSRKESEERMEEAEDIRGRRAMYSQQLGPYNKAKGYMQQDPTALQGMGVANPMAGRMYYDRGGKAYAIALNNSNNYLPNTVNANYETTTDGTGYQSGGKKWIQEATASIKRRGTEGVCTGDNFGSSSCPPGSKRYNLAQTFRKMAHNRQEGGPAPLKQLKDEGFGKWEKGVKGAGPGGSTLWFVSDKPIMSSRLESMSPEEVEEEKQRYLGVDPEDVHYRSYLDDAIRHKINYAKQQKAENRRFPAQTAFQRGGPFEMGPPTEEQLEDLFPLMTSAPAQKYRYSRPGGRELYYSPQQWEKLRSLPEEQKFDYMQSLNIYDPRNIYAGATPIPRKEVPPRKQYVARPVRAYFQDGGGFRHGGNPLMARYHNTSKQTYDKKAKGMTESDMWKPVFEDEYMYQGVPDGMEEGWSGMVDQDLIDRYGRAPINMDLMRMGFGSGGNYGMIPGKGNSKADDKQVDLQDGSYVIPNDSNSQGDHKINIAKSILAMLGYDPDKKYPSDGGKSGNVNISSKEMVLSPRQSDQFDMVMGGEANKEGFFSPNSIYNNMYAPGSFQNGGPNETEEEEEEAEFPEIDLTPEGQRRAQEKTETLRAFYEANPNVEMTAADKAALGIPAGMQNGKTQTVGGAPPPPKQEDTSTEMFKAFERANKNLLVANVAASAGEGIWNLAQRFTPLPKPMQYTPERLSVDTGSLESKLRQESAKAAAAARYNARNLGMGSLEQTNVGIHANELEQGQKNAAMIEDIKNRVNEGNVNLRNQASLYNLGNLNQWATANQQWNAQFRDKKAAALSQNIGTLMQGYGSYVNNKLGAMAIKAGMDQSTYLNSLYLKAKNNPASLTPEQRQLLLDLQGSVPDPTGTTGKQGKQGD